MECSTMSFLLPWFDQRDSTTSAHLVRNSGFYFKFHWMRCLNKETICSISAVSSIFARMLLLSWMSYKTSPIISVSLEFMDEVFSIPCSSRKYFLHSKSFAIMSLKLLRSTYILFSASSLCSFLIYSGNWGIFFGSKLRHYLASLPVAFHFGWIASVCSCIYSWASRSFLLLTV